PSRNEVSRAARELSILPSGVTEFDKHGRRLYYITDAKLGTISLLQGITRITPLYCQVQTLRMSGASPEIAWDMRIATSTLPPVRLKEILHHELDMNKASEWMKIVRFYIQAGRYKEARDELTEAISRFPELAEYQNLIEQQNLEIANQLFREIELRRRSGQHQFASTWLQKIDMKTLPVETQLKVSDQIEKMKQDITRISDVTKALKEDVAKLPAADSQVIGPVVEEITKEINLDSAPRLNDYIRLRADASMSNEQHVSLALGGWLAGAGSGIDNFAVTRSMVRVRALVTEYLSTANSTRRGEILALLKKEEAGAPEMIGKVVANMKPPLPLPTPAADDPAGLYRLTIPADDMNAQPTNYVVQLPPEYDPRRKYPCVLALSALGTPPEFEIGWWSGGYDAELKTRHGTASRYGYIVISPAWWTESQTRYDYSEAEHSRILRCFRDAMRRTSIDTDRVFIAGHNDGGAAAWDIALAHPDMWAGIIALSPVAEKFIVQYKANAMVMPSYIVWGQFAAKRFLENLGTTVDPYLKSPKFDSIAVEYRGRPQDHFLEELPRIMDWMELSNHRRNLTPKEIDLVTSRSGDRFFYWLELLDFDPQLNVNPYLFQDGKRGTINASILPAANGVRVTKAPSKSFVLWIRPGMVDIARKVEVSGRSGSPKKFDVEFDTEVLLE
ncbi:MAG: alpha/beta hydrolase-fold protein, partial [Pirellulales bacterium]